MSSIQGSPVLFANRYKVPGNAGDILRSVPNTGDSAINNSGGVPAIKLIDLSTTSVDGGTGIIGIAGASFSVPFDTDAATTADAIKTALEANSVVNAAVTVESATGVVTLTGRVAGNNFPLTVTGYTATSTPVDPVVDDGTGDSQVATSGSTLPVGRVAVWITGNAPDQVSLPSATGQTFRGIVLREGETETTFSNVIEYEDGKAVPLGTKGEFVVPVENAVIAPYAPAFFRVASGTLGVLTTIDDGDTDPIPGTARFVPQSERYSSATDVTFQDQNQVQCAVLQIL